MTLNLGRYGVWSSRRVADAALGVRLEGLGVPTLWLGSSDDRLAVAGDILAVTERLIVATGIVNIWRVGPEDAAADYRAAVARHGDRLLLGIGSGHREVTGAEAATPYDELVRYLDVLEAEGVPLDRVVVAALGPRVLELSKRTAGAHPYFVPPEHTTAARAVLGADGLLAPEQTVVFDPDPAAALETAREWVARYLKLANYRNNLLRLGYDLDALRRLDDDVVAAVVAWGSDADIRARLDAHLAAGADHVAVQVLGEDRDFERLAALLGLG